MTCNLRRLTVLLCVLGYLAQGIAACMHQHAVSPARASASVVRADTHPDDRADPADAGGAMCSLCQFTLIGGGLPPVAASCAPAVDAASLCVPDREIARFFTATPSHSWQGRAPPRMQ